MNKSVFAFSVGQVLIRKVCTQPKACQKENQLLCEFTKIFDTGVCENIKILRNFCRMAASKLDSVPLVKIDDGVFKYVLIKVYEKTSDTPFRMVVRGNKNGNWHSDIYDEFRESVEPMGLETECLGGGRIEHRPADKLIKVYGYSQGFGKADHAESKRILQTQYKDYEIEISDDGY